MRCPECGGDFERLTGHSCQSLVPDDAQPAFKTLADLPEYLDYLEQSLVDLDIDLKLPANMMSPSVWADRVRTALAAQPPAAPVETPYLGKSFIITSEAAEKIHALPSNLTPSERLRQAVQIARDNPPTKSSAMAMAEAKTAPVLIAAHASEGLPSSDAAGAGAVSRSSADTDDAQEIASVEEIASAIGDAKARGLPASIVILERFDVLRRA